MLCLLHRHPPFLCHVIFFFVSATDSTSLQQLKCLSTLQKLSPFAFNLHIPSHFHTTFIDQPLANKNYCTMVLTRRAARVAAQAETNSNTLTQSTNEQQKPLSNDQNVTPHPNHDYNENDNDLPRDNDSDASSLRETNVNLIKSDAQKRESKFRAAISWRLGFGMFIISLNISTSALFSFLSCSSNNCCNRSINILLQAIYLLPWL